MNLIIILALSFLGSGLATPNLVDWSKVNPLESYANIPLTQRLSANSPEGRITNGELAAPKQFPYQVLLLLYQDEGRAFCGGSLISNSWILTAAHCTIDAKGADVYLGTFDRTNNKTDPGQKIIKVPKENLLTHESYNADETTNDIALIQLPEPIEFNDYIQPVALPKKSSKYDTYAGKRAIASGWGKTSDLDTTATDKLRWAEVPIISNLVCNLRYLFSIKSTHICIRTSFGSSTCNGDSGGPLVYNDGESKYLIGITSFGVALGCEAGFPAVFTRTTSFLDWIEAKSGVSNV